MQLPKVLILLAFIELVNSAFWTKRNITFGSNGNGKDVILYQYCAINRHIDMSMI